MTSEAAAKTKQAHSRPTLQFCPDLVLKEQKVVHPFSLDSFAVQRLEVQRWRDILAVPYANYKSIVVPH